MFLGNIPKIYITQYRYIFFLYFKNILYIPFRDFWMICILRGRFNVMVLLRYYRAMSPENEWQPRQIFSARWVRQFVMANTLQACLRLLAKTVGRCRRRRCKPLMTLCGTWERTAVLRCLVFSKRVDPCRGRRRSSVPSSTTTTMITTFSLRQLQLKWHCRRQVVSCISSAPSLTSFSSISSLFLSFSFVVVSRKFMTGYIFQYLSPSRDNHSAPDGTF